MTDQLIRFNMESNDFPASREGIHRILMAGNQTLLDWGDAETAQPLGDGMKIDMEIVPREEGEQLLFVLRLYQGI